MRRWAITLVVLALCGLAAGCSGGGSAPSTPAPPGVTISPPTISVRAGATQSFTAAVKGETDPNLTWLVNGTPGGNAAIGTIVLTSLTSAVYTAPATVPSPNTVTIQAQVTVDPAVAAAAQATLLNPIPQITAISPSPVNAGPFFITVIGAGFVSGATVNFGSTALATTFLSSTELTASGTAGASQVGAVPIVVTNPDPGSAVSGVYSAQVAAGTAVSADVADRFLQQTTFGPTPALIAQVQQEGLQTFLANQFNLPVSPYADPAAGEMGLGPLQQRFFLQLLGAPDQLRQRVAFALSQIFVIAGDKINTAVAFTPYLRLLEADAFDNYRQIMQDVTLSPAMGHYLDMVNNDKPNPALGTHANENYARELMQLFTIGLSFLNDDGSLQLDGSGNPIPTYTQDTVVAFARAYTGWTYPTQPGATAQKHNPPYWDGPMVALDSNHDTDPKQFLQYPGAANGGLAPSGQTAGQDLTAALDNIFNHPDVPAFVSRQLIRRLVTSNPSPAYIQRIAAVFKNNGAGVRGDMQAVVTAILLDPEARRGDDPATASPADGHLQEPILFMTGLLRVFGATSDGSGLAGQGASMGQTALFPPSVFNFDSPNFVIPGTHTVGPEFQLLTTSTALARANWVNALAFGSLGTGTKVDYSSFAAQASNPAALLDSLDTLLMHGSMSSSMQTGILTAMKAVPAGTNQALNQARTAIYLIASSSQYQVQR
ncbi:MAG TPA: DUF1800 family protein [Candidatus Acidoferrales bacterium]|nr:DUF1800 family protein [Candidatus Acidoferrales bacterium]